MTRVEEIVAKVHAKYEASANEYIKKSSSELHGLVQLATVRNSIIVALRQHSNPTALSDLMVSMGGLIEVVNGELAKWPELEPEEPAGA